MSERRVVGVLGGTFDPVHLGHLALAQHVRAAFELERVLFVLAGVPPHKPELALAPVADREAMLRRALAGRPGLEPSTIESERGAVCYTIDTLRELRGRGTDPLFILGADALMQLPRWRSWRELLAEFDFVTVARPGTADPALDPAIAARLVAIDAGASPLRPAPGAGGRVFRLPFEPLEVSSSAVRARVAAGCGIGDLVPPEVAAYIAGVGLYRGR